MRGSSPQGSVARVRKQRAHSVGSAACDAGGRVLSSKHDFLDDVRRVREDSRGDDASEVFAGDARKRGHYQRTRTQSRYASPPRAAQRSQAGRRPHVPRARRRACSIVPTCLGYEPPQRWGSLFPQNGWESALPAACRPPQTGPPITTGLLLHLCLSTPLLQSKSKISRSRVQHKRWRKSGEQHDIRDRHGLVSLQLAT